MYSNNIKDILARAQYILACCQTEGNFILDGHTKTEEEKRNEESCRSLCKTIEKILNVGPSGQRRRAAGFSDQRRRAVAVEENIADLLDTYDMLYRIGYGRQPDPNFMESQRNRVYQAWLKGNSMLSESDIFALLSKDLQKSQQLSDLYITILENWLMTLKRHECFPEVTGYENYRRLALLMRLNLDRYFNDSQFSVTELKSKKAIITLSDRYDEADEAKWCWYVKNRLEESDLKALPTVILKSYRAFNSSLFPTIHDYEDQQETDTLILEELSTRPDLHPYERKSYRLLTSKYKELV